MSNNIACTKAKLGNVGYILPEEVDLYQQALVQVTRQLKAAIQGEIKTQNLCNQHQEKLIHQHKAAGNSKLAKKIRGICHVENTKRVFQKCCAARQQSHEGGLSHVLIPPEHMEDDPRICKNWRRVDCPTEMANILMERNQAHFSQSKGCPLTLYPLDVTINFTATCTRANSILDGTFLCPTLPTHLSQVESSNFETAPLTLDNTQSNVDTATIFG